MVEGGATPIVPRDRLAELGFTLVLYANAALRAAQHNVLVVLEHLMREGTTEGMTHRMASWTERQNAVGKPYFDELEERYKS
jgi:2-methylisocitrate lyase-like PEP mutase family enzyme